MKDIESVSNTGSSGLVRSITRIALITSKLKSKGMKFKAFAKGFFSKERSEHKLIEYYDAKTDEWVFVEVDRNR